MTALRIIFHALVLLWWLPAIVLVFVRPALFALGYQYRARRAHRLMQAGKLAEADRVMARLRRDTVRYRLSLIRNLARDRSGPRHRTQK